MQPCDDLTYHGQAGRMRALARRALVRFGLREDTPLVLCGHAENTVFAVPGARGMRYALRIHRLDYQTPATIRSELEWLAALGRDTDLTVQRPRRGRDGAYVQRVGHAGVPGARSCMLLGWVDGDRVGARRGAATMERLGALAATLHEHARRWKRPRGFTRRRWGEIELLVRPAWGDPLLAPGLRRREWKLFMAARDRAVARLQAFGKGPARWGLIHADLHSGNVVRRDGELRPIDFDDAGFGWYVFDIMIAAAQPYWATPAYEPMMARFLRGYRGVRAFEDADLACIEDFIVTRALDIVGWLANRRDNPRLAALIPTAIARARPLCRAYLRSP